MVLSVDTVCTVIYRKSQKVVSYREAVRCQQREIKFETPTSDRKYSELVKTLTCESEIIFAQRDAMQPPPLLYKRKINFKPPILSQSIAQMSFEISISFPGSPATGLTSNSSPEQPRTISDNMDHRSSASSDLSSLSLLADVNSASGTKDVSFVKLKAEDKGEASKRLGDGFMQSPRIEKAKKIKLGDDGETREKGIYCHQSDTTISVMNVES